MADSTFTYWAANEQRSLPTRNHGRRIGALLATMRATNSDRSILRCPVNFRRWRFSERDRLAALRAIDGEIPLSSLDEFRALRHYPVPSCLI